MSAPETNAAPRAKTASCVNWFATLLLLAAAGWFGWAVSRGWNNGNLPGCEFRQSQTALSAYFIQRDHDFSLAYPTPVLGKPWSIPMEFPLYQWSAVALSKATGLPLIQAGRTVSLVCLLLALPAVALLLRRIGLDRPQRLVAMGLVLTCPLLIFYARSFLIETMALMASLWFTAAFVETLRTRSVFWLIVASVAGAVAGTVKVTTFILYLIPAAGWGGWCLLRAWRERVGSWRQVVGVLGWGLGSVAVPFLATMAWTDFADAVKALNPSGAFLVSDNLMGYNFGLGDLNVRFSATAWLDMLHFWQHGILPVPVVVAVTAVAVLFGGRWRWPALGCIGLFFLAQFIFPKLYASHEYYFVANAALLVLAASFTLAATTESPCCPRWLGGLAAVALLVSQALLFSRSYWRPDLSYVSPGGTGLTQLLRHLTDPNELLVIVGKDWDSTTPFNAQRRTLMVRHGLEHDWSYIRSAFRALGVDPVGALLLCGEQRQNTELLKHAESELGIDPRPVLEHGDTTVYLHRDLVANRTWEILRGVPYDQVIWHELFQPLVAPRTLAAEEILTDSLRGREQLLFARMSPRPYKFYLQFGAGTTPRGDMRTLNADPLTRLWFRVPKEATTVDIGFGLADGAYTDPQRSTDGAELRLSALQPDGSLRQIFSRVINPRDIPADRGEQQASVALPSGTAYDLVLETLPGPSGSAAFDWVFIGDIKIR